jgi:hypothetical protein
MNGSWEKSGDEWPRHCPGGNLIREILMAGKPLVSGNPAGVIKQMCCLTTPCPFGTLWRTVGRIDSAQPDRFQMTK